MVTLPVVALREVAHVGTLDPADKHARFATSYEGGGLSVSLDPDTWTRIARLGGQPTHWLSRRDGRPWRLLDAHALARTHRDRVEQWAVDHGWAGRRTGWQVTWFDDEDDCAMSTVFDDPGDAVEEAASRGADPPVPLTRLVASATLARWHGSDGYTGGDAWDLLVVVAAAETGHDGVWWDDTPGHLSAPRGMLLADAAATAIRR